MPAMCDDKKSLSLLGMIKNQTPLVADDPDPYQGLNIILPAHWRNIPVRHVTTGDTGLVQLRFIGFSGLLNPSPTSKDITGIEDPQASHDALWNGGGMGIAPSPCVSRYSQVESRDRLRFLWLNTMVARCAKQSAYSAWGASIFDPEVLYELRTPTPLDMAAGVWEGDASYLAGPGGDFDFGDNFLLNFSEIDIKVSLTVAHHLRAVFPPGADRLALEPEGGWIPWLTRGRRPERIMRDQPFQFTSSGPVKMRVECQHLISGNCAIENPAGHRVPVETRISLPAGMQALTGGPVSRVLLNSSDDAIAVTDRYVAQQTGQLHFEVGRSDVEAMLTYPETTYAGNVTVVWDSYLK